MLLTLFVAALGTAAAAPMSLTHTGRVLDVDGAPLNGPTSIEVTFHSEATNGTLLWTAPPLVVDLSDGYFAVELSAGSPPLDSSIFAGAEVWVDTALSGVAQSSRTRLHSVPYAIQASSSQGITVVSGLPSGGCTDGAFHFDSTASELRVCVSGSWQSAAPGASSTATLDCTCVSNGGGSVGVGVNTRTATLTSGYERTGGGCHVTTANERQLIRNYPTGANAWTCASTDEDNARGSTLNPYVCGCRI